MTWRKRLGLLMELPWDVTELVQWGLGWYLGDDRGIEGTNTVWELSRLLRTLGEELRVCLGILVPRRLTGHEGIPQLATVESATLWHLRRVLASKVVHESRPKATAALAGRAEWRSSLREPG